MTVATFADAAALSERAPRSSLAARFSIPFTLATRLMRGQAGVADFAEMALADPRVGEVARRITVVEDPEMSALVPRQRLTRLIIKLDGGATLQSDVSGSVGDFDRPLPPGGLARKFADLTQGCWGSAGLSIYEDCLAVASCPSSRSLIGRMARTELPG